VEPSYVESATAGSLKIQYEFAALYHDQSNTINKDIEETNNQKKSVI
jgi:hypothetical protein